MDSLNNLSNNSSGHIPNVSIVIPVYNRAGFVPSIIKHLLDQNYDDFETIFVVNENSTDNSIQIVQTCMSDLPDSRMITHKENITFGEARNVGADNAEGNLIWFLDIDDKPLPDFLKCLTDIQSEYDADIVACNFVYSSSDDTVIDFDDELEIKVMSKTEALIARSKEIIPVSTWSKLFKRDLIINNGLKFISSLSEDIYYTYNAISCSKTICFYNRPLYMYRINPNSVTNDKRKSDERGLSEIRAYDDLEEMFAENDIFFPMFRIRSSLIRLRSSGHMSYQEFLKYAKSERCKNMIERNLKIPLSFESIWYRILPRSYYITIHIFFKFEYYRDGRVFYKKHRWYNGALMGWK